MSTFCIRETEMMKS